MIQLRRIFGYSSRSVTHTPTAAQPRAGARPAVPVHPPNKSSHRQQTAHHTMDARWMKLDYPAFVHVANSLTPIPWPGWRPLQHAAQLNLALSACKPARRTAALLKRREGLGGRRVWGGGQRQQAAQLALTIVDEKPADVVWWDEGAPVQSLEIRCR